MAALKINWAPGQLRQFESVVSFLGRFSKLNGLTPAGAVSYFSQRLGGNIFGTPVPDELLSSFAAALSEPIDIVKTVFAPTVDIAFHDLWVRRTGLLCGVTDQRAGYCPECIVHGYHSYLHDAAWLSKCPFHGTTLKPLPFVAGNKFFGAIKAYAKLAEDTCKSWPWRPANAETRLLDLIGPLQDWLCVARRAASELSCGLCWTSAGSREISAREVIGQLCSIVPMPDNLTHLFVSRGDNWDVELHKYPLKENAEVLNILRRVSWDLLLRYFHLTSAYAVSKPSYYTVLRASQDSLRRWHSSDAVGGYCLCSWARSTYFNSYVWSSRSEDSWLGRQFPCPVDHAIEELEMLWGDQRLSGNDRRAREALTSFIMLSRELKDYGLVEFNEGAYFLSGVNSSTIGPSSNFCEWTAPAMLTEVLNGLTIALIQSRTLELNKWLYEIKSNGISPSNTFIASQPVRLCMTEEYLTTQLWKRHDLLESMQYTPSPDAELIGTAQLAGHDGESLHSVLKELHEARIARAAAKFFARYDTQDRKPH